MDSNTEELRYNLRKSIINLSKNYYQKKELDELLNFIFESFTFIPDFEFASFYFLEKENYEFILEHTLPNNIDVVKYFNQLVENNIIGKVLSSGEFEIFNNSKIKNNTILILPITGYDGFLGLMIIGYIGDKVSILNSLSIELEFLGYISSALISSIISYIEKQNIKELQEQLIAYQTLELEKKQHNLKIKMEQLTSNLNRSIPHEIRTPLLHILGLTDFIIKSSDFKKLENGEEIIDMLNDITFSAKRLNNMIDNYIFYANLVTLTYDINEIQKYNYKITEDIDSIIYELINEEAYIKDRYDDIEVDLCEGNVVGDHILINKLFYEVINNAFKFSTKGTKVKVKSFIENNFYVCSITDYGIGMDITEIETIGPYVQFNRDENEQQGIGLGLAIVNKILALFNGDIKINSKKNEFTEIIIYLHLANNKDLK